MEVQVDVGAILIRFINNLAERHRSHRATGSTHSSQLPVASAKV